MTSNGGFSDGIHLKTYTAGEDGSRLAEMAKEFGLARQRQPRKQVRERVSAELLSLPAKVVQYMGDPSFQDVRMRSIYTSHDQLPDDEEGERLMGRRPSWMEAEGAIPEEGEDQDPHAHGVGGSLLSAGLGIFKGMVGPAILYLPHAFAAAGFAAALPMLVVTTTLFLYSSTCLLDSWRIESTKETGEQQSLIESGKKKRVRKMLSYPELAYRALGTTGESLVKIGIALMQSGVCLSYLIFVPQNLSKCTEFFMGWHIAPSYFMVVMLVLQIPLSWIRDIRKLTITNLMANLLILFGLTICLGFAVSSAVESDSGRGPLEEIGYKFSQLDPFKSTWFLFIGTSVFLFEGSITLLVPLQEAVHTKEDRAKFPSVYRRVIFGIIIFEASFGIVCWMSFGSTVRTVLTTSLPEGALATTVQLAYCLAVIFTFPLQNFPSLEIACRSIKQGMRRTCGSSTLWLQKRNVISSVLILCLAIVAICTMDSLDKVVSLMGSLLGCPIAFIFPPLIHLKLDEHITPARKRGDQIVVAAGFCAMILASAITLLTW